MKVSSVYMYSRLCKRFNTKKIITAPRNVLKTGVLINPRRMCEGYGSSSSVCVSVSLYVCTMITATYLVFRRNSGVTRLSVLISTMHYVGFVENALFKSFSDIC